MGSPINTNIYAGTGGTAINLGSDTTYPDSKGRYPRRILATVSGIVRVDTVEGDVALDVPIGAYSGESIQVKKIYSTGNGTTCTGVVVVF
jgi:hypothetical protein